MRFPSFYAVILALIGILSSAQWANAQGLWSPPGEPVSLTEEQTQAVMKLSEAMGIVENFMVGERCYVENNGKCADNNLPDVSQKAGVEQFIAATKSCAEASRAAQQAGVPSTYPVDFDRHHEPAFSGPVSLRNTEHFCNLYRGFAERHLVFFDRNVASAIFDDYKGESAMVEVGSSVARLFTWQEIYQCYQKSDKCEAQPDIRLPESLESWVKYGEECLDDIKAAKDADLADDTPIEFAPDNIAGLQSPETLTVAAKYCQEQADLAKSIAEKSQADAAAAAAAQQAAEDAAAQQAAANGPVTLTADQSKILEQLSQKSAQAVTAVEAHTIPNSSNAGNLNDPAIVKYWVDNGNECKTLVESALKAGVPADYPFEFSPYDSGLQSPMKLAQYGTDICGKAVELSTATLQKLQGAAQAALAPYLEALNGDRKQLFQSEGLISSKVRGPGGTVLETPEDFAKAPAWYETSHDNSGVNPRWIVSGWQFDGDSVAQRYSNSGWGESAPSDAYPNAGSGAGTRGAGSSSSSSGGGFLSFLLWFILLVAVFGAAGLAAYAYLGLKIAMVERVLDKVPPVRDILNKIPKKN